MSQPEVCKPDHERNSKVTVHENRTFGQAFRMISELLEDEEQAAELLAIAVRDGSVSFEDDPDITKIEYRASDIFEMLFDITTS